MSEKLTKIKEVTITWALRLGYGIFGILAVGLVTYSIKLNSVGMALFGILLGFVAKTCLDEEIDYEHTLSWRKKEAKQ